jgi:hypothetical protein
MRKIILFIYYIDSSLIKISATLLIPNVYQSENLLPLNEEDSQTNLIPTGDL